MPFLKLRSRKTIVLKYVDALSQYLLVATTVDLIFHCRYLGIISK
jgi:hypothetical protein